jgi:glycosyltransferase involved in cell wall biosynthesis
MTMARVLIIAYTTYAQDARVKRQAEALASRGDQVEVICLSSGQIGNTNGVTILDLQLPRYRGNSPAAYVRGYCQFIIRAAALAVGRSFGSSYDVVVVCSMPDALVISALPCRLFGSKILLDVKDTMPELCLDKFDGNRGRLGARLLMIEERLSAWLADRVLAVHDPHAERLQEARIAPSKISVVTNLPDPRIFEPASPSGIIERFERNRTSSHFTIVCHATVVRRLGLDTAIEALAILRTRLPDVRLRVIGSGDYLDNIKALSRRLNVECAVSFEEPVPVEELPAKLAGSTVGLVPNHASSATHLMLPVKLLEFATLGMPVIAARLHTIEHYFGEDAVRYFTPGDSGALAEAVEDLYFSPARRLALAQRGWQIAMKLSWQRQSERYYQAVDALLSGRKERPNRNCPAIAEERN